MKWLMTFLLGALVGASGLFLWLREVPDAPAPVVASEQVPAPAPVAIPPAAAASAAADGTLVQTDLAEADLPLRPSSAQPSAVQSPADAVAAPARLLVPVQGIKQASLSDTFDQPRGSQRHHEALDIMAPKGTPVLAVADGKVVKLFQSKPGGTTLYQFDPTGRYAYYYAHLERYADGVKEGMDLKRGDVLGYVGVTGNSDPNAPHLHFSVVELTPEKQWWKGTPLNPYPMMAD